MIVSPDQRELPNDAELLSAIAARDGQAFTVFYRRYLPIALAYLMRETRDPELSADLAAEVFSAVMLSAARYRPQGASAAPWVLGIARNKLLMSLRKGRIEARARQRLGFDPAALEDADLDRVAAVAQTGAGQLAALVERLPQQERQAVLSRVVEERSYQEIAAELRCSEMVVRKRVSRGLARLRAQMDGE
jgi:RNA polymerase sigma factor (sigma-70 family)